MPSPYLSKSRYKVATECPRKLWYLARPAEYANRKSEDPFLQALADGGHQVGALARCLHPDGELIDSPDITAAVARTLELLRRETVVIFEAALQFGPYLAFVDVLRKRKQEIDIVEVKAKSWGSDDSILSKKGMRAAWVPYVEDVAFQSWIARQLFPSMRIKPYLMLVNKSTLISEDGLHQLFRLVRSADDRISVNVIDESRARALGDDMLVPIDVSAEVQSLIDGTSGIDEETEYAPTLPERAKLFADIHAAKEPYAPYIGSRCKACEYRTTAEDVANGLRSGFDECWKQRLKASFRPDRVPAFSLWNLQGKSVDKIAESGRWFLDEVTSADLAMKPRQVRQWEAASGIKIAEIIDPAIGAAISGWRYPLHFLDFETITPAIPFHRGMHPYEVVAFQFSCHHVHVDGRITHDDFLEEQPGVFPTWRFLQALRESIGGDDGTILRYSPHENTVLRAIRTQLLRARRAPGWSPAQFPAGMGVEDYAAWIATITAPTGKEKEEPAGARAMVDLLPLVKDHYFHPAMSGSNSIKQVLPAVLGASLWLKEQYSKPLGFGTHLPGQVLWQADESGVAIDPYKLLPPIFPGLDVDALADEDGDMNSLASGGAAMMAYAEMQYADVPPEKRAAYRGALLRYCELDTLAMLMIVEHWRHALRA